jgi:hypothetical protein
MSTLLARVTSPGLLRALSLCGCLGWLVGGAAFYATTQRLVVGDGVLLGRDFMAFYLAGSMVLNGDGPQLYDGEKQQAMQDAILAPESFEGLAYYINPAPLAVVYSLLAWMPYRWALQVNTALMLAAYAAALWLLLPHLKGLAPYGSVAAMVGLIWFPVIQTITGGQNAALTLLLLVWALVTTARGQQHRAGLALGLLLFKPQYALPFIGLLLLRRRWRTVAVSGAVGLGLYALGALACGWDWPLHMAQALGGIYRQQERQVSGYSHIALTEVVDFSIVQPLEALGLVAAARAARLAAGGLVLMIIASLMWCWRRAEPSAPQFGLYWALVAAAILLISPHTQYYEVALLLLPVLLVLDHLATTGRRLSDAQRCGLIAAFVLYPFFDVARWIHFQPLIILPVWVALWAARLCRGSSCAESTRPG